MISEQFNLSKVLKQAAYSRPLTETQIRFLLNLENKQDIEQLHRAARQIRKEHFGDNVFIYGFLYFSTHCRNNCRFCQYRNDNKRLPRYRKTMTRILTAAEKLKDTGVHLIDLTMGEDPYLYESGLNPLVKLVKAVQNSTHLPVMVSPGVVSEKTIDDLAQAGADWFACYQETYNRTIYSILRAGQDFDERIERKKQALKNGILIEEGLLTGVGESIDDLVHAVTRMRDLPADQVRVMTFVPQKDTPMSNFLAQTDLKERIIISVMRLVMPDRLIPASLDVGGLNGLEKRLDAGANVVTSIVPPEKGFSGVANASLDIDDSRRTVESIIPVLESKSLKIAPMKDYTDWMENRNLIKYKTEFNETGFVSKKR